MGYRCGILSIVAAVLFGAPAANAQLPTQIDAFLKKQCLDCHDAASKEGGLDLSSLSTDVGDPANFVRWVKVHDRVKAGEMPPPKSLQPTVAERDQALQHLGKWLASIDQKRQRESGRVPLRRLNRTEYENTMR